MMNKKVFALAGLLVLVANVANTTNGDKEKVNQGKLAKCYTMAKNYGLPTLALLQSVGFVQGLGTPRCLDEARMKADLGSPTDVYKGFNPSTLNIGYTLGAKSRAIMEATKPAENSGKFFTGITKFAQYLCGNLPPAKKD